MNIFESLQSDIIDIRRELNEFKEQQRLAEKNIRTAQHALVCATEELAELVTKISLNKINPKKCRHEHDEGPRSGLGYSGFRCRKCRTLIVKDIRWPAYPDEDGRAIGYIYPSHPFKFDCKHNGVVLTCVTARARMGRPVVKGRQIFPLSTDGHFCTVCGECWSDEK